MNVVARAAQLNFADIDVGQLFEIERAFSLEADASV